MNEEPKSIWKKSWTGWRGFLLSAVVVFAVVMAIGWLARADAGLSLIIAGILIVVSLVMVFGVGLFRWLVSGRNFKRFLFGFACVATLIALAYAEEDWRGWHAWNQFKHQWEAKGEKFDFKDFIPPPVPDDQNFALTPIVASTYESMLDKGGHEVKPRNTNVVNRLEMPVTRDYNDWPTNGGGNREKATLTDLKPWQDYYRKLALTTNLFPVAPQPQTPAQDVLLALSKYDPTIEELRQASKLRYSRFPLEWDKDDPAAILLPHLAAMKSCLQILRLRATAELQNGQSEKALDDVKLMLSLNQSIRTEPILISHLVRIAMTEITLQPIYEGLAEHRWTEAQLAELDSELGRLDFLADYEFSMRGERVFGIAVTEYLRRSRNLQAMGFNDQGDPSSPLFSNLGFHLAPSSFFYRSELTIARMHQEWTLPLVDMTNHVVSPKKVGQNTTAADKALRHGWPYNILARMMFPAAGNAVFQYARAQSSVDLACTAIALERYRLAHGGYPESLDALAPQFMEKVPHDIIGGQPSQGSGSASGPLHYRRTDDGQFVLYSVGWNERDDGGVVVLNKGSVQTVNRDEGDWVWRYPQK